MKILENKKKLEILLNKVRSQSLKIGLIPTMGSIHKGHLSLIRQSKLHKCFSIATIFVNPTQFNDVDDFNKYPRNKNEDIDILKDSGCDALYFPLTEEIYPREIKSKKTIFDYRDILCDKYRPGHFDGVTTVVKSLFDLIKPNIAFFGEKDFQQIKLINKIVEKYQLPIKINSCPSIRLDNGMSISSRYNNFTLSQKKLLDKVSIKINNCVEILKKDIHLNHLDRLKEELTNYNIKKIDYLEIRNEESLNITKKNIQARLFLAFYINQVRVIDNFILY